MQWFYKGNSHREETPGNPVKPKLSPLPISRLNGQMPFTALERAILPASFVPNCFIWKHPWPISELLACLNACLTVRGLGPSSGLFWLPAWFEISWERVSTNLSLDYTFKFMHFFSRQSWLWMLFQYDPCEQNLGYSQNWEGSEMLPSR